MTDLPAGVTDEMVEAGALATINAEREAFGGDMAPIVDLSNVMPEAIKHHKILARAALTAALAGRVVVPAGLKPLTFAVGDLKVESRGNDLWAVTDGVSCLAIDGHFEYERRPSGRDEEFKARCRFSFEEAVRRATDAANPAPTPAVTPGTRATPPGDQG